MLILASVKSANIAGDQVTIVYQPPKDLVGSFRIAEPAKVRVYYEHLHQRVVQAGVTPQSLALYVGEVFRLAELRSADSDPVAENKAAIVALAMYFGDERFERLAGDVRIGALKLVVPRTACHGRAPSEVKISVVT